MGTRQHKWRSAPSSPIYVDSRTGDDITGDGTIYKPYQSWYRACFHNQPTAETPTSIPNIVLDGIFTGHMPFGYCTTVNGSAWGRAIYDGEDANAIYGFFHNNMIIRRTRPCTSTDPVRLDSYNYAGVGAPYISGYVGVAYNVYGVGGSSVLLDECMLYWGCAGTNGKSSIIFSRLKNNYVKSGTTSTGYKISLGGSSSTSQSTFYLCPIVNRAARLYKSTYTRCLFAAFDMFATDDTVFDQCFFTSETGWYFIKNKVLYKIVIDDTIQSQDTTINLVTGEAVDVDTLYTNVGTATIGGGTVAAFIAEQVAGGMSLADAKASAIPTAITALRAASHITTSPTFTNCKFTSQGVEDTFNNVDVQDFTLKLTSAAVEGAYVTGSGSKKHFGALPPSLNIPIMENSDGIPGTWDERSFSGLLKIDGDKIVIDEESSDTAGEGRTKIIALDNLPARDKVLSAIFAEFSSKFKSHGIVFWDAWELVDRANAINVSSTPTTLTKGIANAPAYYLVEGDANTRLKLVVNGEPLYGVNSIRHGQVVMVDSTQTVTVEYDEDDGGTPAILIPILDSNLPEALDVRMQQAVFAQATSGNIKAGATYLNSGSSTITYNGHQIVPGESFVGVDGETTFTGAPSGYVVDAIFDDDEVSPIVPHSDWIKASFWDEFFTRVDSNATKNKYYLGWGTDTAPAAITTTKSAGKATASSGNPLAYVTTTGTLMYMGEKFIQFRLKCQKVFNA